MNRTTKPMRRTQIRQMSPKREEKLKAERRFNPGSSFALSPQAKPKRQADTGPKRSTRDLVRARSGGMCEWPGCPELQTDIQHRLGRKAGGRHGATKERINGPAWLIATCRLHHIYVTSPHGERREVAMRMGWLLLENQDAIAEPVMTRHDPEPVYLTPAGGWVRFEEACA